MNQSIYTGLINNTALLLILTVLYDVFILRWQQKRDIPQKIITGSLVAGICIGLMLSPWQLAPGIFFDTRSVLLSITGFYFGAIPAVTAAIITSAFRIFQGGSGMYMGVLVILTTTALGIAWRYKRRAMHANPRWTELYLFGIVVHIVMLMCTIALPQEARQSVFNAILLPVLTVYPVATMMLGLIMNTWIDRQQMDDRLRESDVRWQLALESADAGIWDLDVPTMKVRFSKQGRALLGYLPFEQVMPYQKWLELIHLDDRARSDMEMRAVIAGKVPLFLSERRVQKADGSYMWVMTRGKVSRRDENGRTLQITGITADISAQMSSEAERQRMFEIINASPAEVYVLDCATLKFEYVSAGALRNLGYPLERMREMTPVDIATDFDYDSLAALFAPLQRGQVNQLVFETTHQRANGTLYPIEIHLQLFTRQENPVYFAIALDISERRKKDSQIEHMASFPRFNPNPVLEIDPYKGIVYQNAAAEKTFPDLHKLGLEHPLLRDLDLTNLHAVGNSMNPMQGECEVDGHWYWKTGMYFPETGTWRLYLMEITPTKMAEQALRKSEEQYRLLFSEMTSGSAVHQIICDTSGKPVDYRFLAVNAAFENLTGLKATEIIGKTVRQVIPDIEPPWIERYGRVVLTGEPTSFEEYFAPLKKYFDIRAYSTEKDTFAVIFQDITERKQTEKLIQEMNVVLEERVKQRTAQLESANLELEAFSYSVSHDLRAPLRAIDGFVSILEEDYSPRLDDEARRLIGVIRGNTHAMGQLIDDLLRYSRMTRAEMAFEEVDMASLVRAVFFELTKELERKRVDFQVGRLPIVQGDPTMLRQVWMNLVGNALKFTSKREQAVIKVSSRREEGEVIFCVEDNGAGFDMQYVDKLFNVFQRLHSSAEFEGTGVGLAIVKRIILRHRGRVWAQAEVDAGAKLYFSLPGIQKGLKNGKEL